MITRIRALNYRCLRYVDVALDRFHVLIGRNASGKSTLFDVVSFLGDFVRDGLEKAVANRTYNFQDLVWNRPREGLGFQLALDFHIPLNLRDRLPAECGFHTYRYEIAVREIDDLPHIHCERGTLIAGCPTPALSQTSRKSFPEPARPPRTILTEGQRENALVVLESGRGHRLKVAAEDQEPGTMHGETPLREISGQLLIDPLVSHLRFLDKSRFPVSMYVFSLLSGHVNPVFLESVKMRQPSTARSTSEFLSRGGAKLPWLIKHVQETDSDVYDQWLQHVRTVLDDLVDIRIVERPEDLTRYLMLKYSTGVEVPSWMVSDGTLRFLATMLVAYLASEDKIVLLEEPENGVHPLALEPIYDSASSALGSQILIATHSPAFLAMASPREVLCFAKTGDGQADIVRGDCHPFLAGWQESADINVLFGQGIIE